MSHLTYFRLLWDEVNHTEVRGLPLRTRQWGEGRANATGSRAVLIRHTSLRLCSGVSVPADGDGCTSRKAMATETMETQMLPRH